MNFSYKDDCDLDMTDGAVKNENIDIPEDLSAKSKSVSVQTDKCGTDKFEDLFDGFSQNQIKSFMDILVKFVLKRDNESIVDPKPAVPDNYKKHASPHTNHTRWTPLEPESGPTISSQFSVHKAAFHSYTQPSPLQSVKTTQPIQNTNQFGQIVNLQPVTVKTYKAKVENENQKIYLQQNLTERRKLEETGKSIESEAQLTEITKQSYFVGAGVQSFYDEHNQTRIESEDEESESSSFYQGRLSRDEKLVMNMKIHLTVQEIIQKPMEEFNDLLSSKAVNEEQMNICRDIRRRGKNKIAAQNCRKRKIEQITGLEKDLRLARSRKENILSERVELLQRQQELVSRLGRLERDILMEMGKEDWVILVDRNMLVHLEKKNVM